MIHTPLVSQSSKKSWLHKDQFQGPTHSGLLIHTCWSYILRIFALLRGDISSYLADSPDHSPCVCLLVLFLAQVAEKVTACAVFVLFSQRRGFAQGTGGVPGAYWQSCTTDPANSLYIPVNKINSIMLWSFSNNNEGEDLWYGVRKLVRKGSLCPAVPELGVVVGWLLFSLCKDSLQEMPTEAGD